MLCKIANKTLFLFVLLFINQTILAQTERDSFPVHSLSGIILDAKSQQPLVGAVVQLKEFPLEVITDKNGRFLLKSVASLPATLIVTFVGYERLEQTVNNRTVQLSLRPNTGYVRLSDNGLY